MHVTYPLSLSLGLNQVLNPKSRDHHPQNQTHTPIARKQTTLINSLNTRTTTFIHLRLAHDALSSGVRQTNGAHLAEIACGCPEVTPTRQTQENRTISFSVVLASAVQNVLAQS